MRLIATTSILLISVLFTIFCSCKGKCDPVIPPEIPPNALAIADPLIQVVDYPVHFQDGGSFAAEGRTIVKYEWDWNNDGTFDEEGNNAEHSWEWPGTFLIQLRVTDNEGSIDILNDPIEIVIKPLYGLNFSPYKGDQDPNQGDEIPPEQIIEAIEIIAPDTLWIRSFGVTHGLELVGSIAHDHGLYTAIGAWLGPDLAPNEEQIEALIDLANAGDVDIAIVGSEVLLRGDLSEGELIEYINRVKAEIPEGIPVTTADIYGVLMSHPAVISECDVIFANFYPFWEGVNIECALATLHEDYFQDLLPLSSEKDVYVSESGWPSCGDNVDLAFPSLDNACFYFLNFVSWARAENVKYFYFEAFDEPWKAFYGEGNLGACWGVWDRDWVLKPCMQPVLDGQMMDDNWTPPFVPCPGDPPLAFTHVPPYGSFENLQGRVCGVDVAEHMVAVYIKVGNGWWTKPTWDNPLTPIRCDGSWVCDITTGGIDHQANTIGACLLNL